MKFWQERLTLRMILILLFFAAGIAMIVVGWRMTGEIAGLGIMLLGIVALLVTLFLYNKRFQ